MLSPRSQGKGGRRFPGRDGGRRKRKTLPAWRKRAQHAVTSSAELPEPLPQFQIPGSYGDSAHDIIYKFDQCMAKAGLRYYAECTGRRHRWLFKVWVSAGRASDVREIIARIEAK